MVEGIAGGQLLILSFKHKICYTTLSVTGKAIIVWFNFPLNDCTGDQSQFFMMEKEIFCYFVCYLKIIIIKAYISSTRLCLPVCLFFFLEMELIIFIFLLLNNQAILLVVCWFFGGFFSIFSSLTKVTSM